MYVLGWLPPHCGSTSAPSISWSVSTAPSVPRCAGLTGIPRKIHWYLMANYKVMVGVKIWVRVRKFRHHSWFLTHPGFSISGPWCHIYHSSRGPIAPLFKVSLFDSNFCLIPETSIKEGTYPNRLLSMRRSRLSPFFIETSSEVWDIPSFGGSEYSTPGTGICGNGFSGYPDFSECISHQPHDHLVIVLVCRMPPIV